MNNRQLIDWAHRIAATPSPGEHDMDPPHPYCFGDDPCVCIQVYAAEERALLTLYDRSGSE